jgi:hypothetical protein
MRYFGRLGVEFIDENGGGAGCTFAQAATEKGLGFACADHKSDSHSKPAPLSRAGPLSRPEDQPENEDININDVSRRWPAYPSGQKLTVITGPGAYSSQRPGLFSVLTCRVGPGEPLGGEAGWSPSPGAKLVGHR